MPRNYLPGSDAGLRAWSENFATLIGADPGAYGITPSEAAAYAGTRAVFAAAYERAINPATRGPAAVLHKNIQRKVLVQASRRLARQAMSRPGVTNEQLLALGLNPRRKRRRYVPGPTVAPVVWVTPRGEGRIELRLRNLENPQRKGRPVDVSGAVVFWAVGDQRPSANGEREAGLWGKPARPGAAWSVYKATNQVRWVDRYPAGLAAGTVVWFTACWLSPRGEPGPYATPARLVVGFDAVPAFGKGVTSCRPSPTRLSA